MNQSILREPSPDRDEILRGAADLAAEQGQDQVADVLPRVLEHVAPEDLAEREPADLAGAVQSMYELAGTRRQGQTLVRVLSPQREANGWTSPHSSVLVCTDDMPFLVDSLAAAAAAEGLSVHLVVHPQLMVRRDRDGNLSEVLSERPPADQGIAESWMHLEVDRITDADRLDRLQQRVEEVLEDVRKSVQDWQAMRQKCQQITSDLVRSVPHTVDSAEVGPTREFLTWLADDHFTFLGYREYSLDTVDGEDVLRPVPESGLGILRGEPEKPYTRLQPQAQATAREPRLLTITKANSRATVHKSTYLDYIGIRTFDDSGAVTGERRFLGMLTSSAYAESVLRLPIAADKVREVLHRSGFSAHSHSGKDLLQVLENFPRDELFQTDVATLAEVAQEVLYLQERRRSKLFLRTDEFGRFVSALVFIPRDRYNTAVRLAMEHVLRKAYRAETVEFTTRVADSPLAQLHFVVRVRHGRALPEVDVEQIQSELVRATRTWEEKVLEAALDRVPQEQAYDLVATYTGRFAEAYKEMVSPDAAVSDLLALEGLADDDDTALALYRPEEANPGERRLKVYRRSPVSLTEVLGTFTDLGVEVLDERPFRVRATDTQAEAFVYDFGLRAGSEDLWVTDDRERRFTEAFLATRAGLAESDVLGHLVLSAGLDWREVVVLRTIARYLRQVGSIFSVEYLEAGLVANPELATKLVRLFEARFDPDHPSGTDMTARRHAEETLTSEIITALDDVPSLDHDRMVRAYMGVIGATQRTNYFCTDAEGNPVEHISFKIDCAQVPGIPSPVPTAEIWVYSPQVEGVHLRFGKVARGGLRWSDRREDFRTEVLGLVKAQMVKNAVIVPGGSKGGFYAKQLPDPAADRDAWLAEGEASYRAFIRGMLDVTDNRRGDEVVPPERVVRHDDDDPYLVVAADKGTATFSDVANEISAEYEFWLDDAFASGGSAGYDHKAMGITARGAWESVKRHFRERGMDTQSEDFTVVGIGDMSGDVFGNGMLLSEHIRLVGAFDHRHIFLDPDPDATTSFAERERLFSEARTTWESYDTDLISDGGGVYPRTAKSIEITPQVRATLGLGEDVTELAPTELIKAMLLAPVDLLWNGGIGTYIKSSAESHSDIGDRANDAIRVDGRDLRVKVVGEGGNLGASQLGRIEAAMNGVRINTDAIDNSAGVSSSDLEVNIKIPLREVMRDGGLDRSERNELLASMTDEVAELVLRDNYEQNVLLSNSRAQSAQMLGVHRRLIQWLVKRGDLDRELEFLPDEEELDARAEAGHGLTQPEFSVLMAYSKIALKDDLARTSIADGSWFSKTLAEYFPTAMREKYADAIEAHPLRSEIIINTVVNSMVNRGGISFAFRAADETGASSEQVARAYAASREIFDLVEFTSAVEALDTKVDAGTQAELYLSFRRLLDRATRWFAHQRHDQLDVAAEIERFSERVTALRAQLPQFLRGSELERFHARAEQMREAGVPEELAQQFAGLLPSLSLLDVVQLADEAECPPERSAELYFAVSERFRIDDLLIEVAGLPRDERWATLARASMRDDLYATAELLSAVIMRETEEDAAPARIENWAEQIGAAVGRVEESLADILAIDSPGLAPLSVALRGVRSLLR
ncbi:NAD-glutamate dehydrogenase [Pseudactinotalea sp. Z1748]|uniref:NAD-glutamate dehydrogenase n=1 Tax=Pseudactinotalea sp. Z1748 TaxID=3413027 RepID=UPI003C7B9416